MFFFVMLGVVFQIFVYDSIFIFDLVFVVIGLSTPSTSLNSYAYKKMSSC